ncbi:hypothetical protein M0R72_04840 [Candidatus Pacearchaeota archaeon]|jgi:hypothetical protein|nr:hypothetical protein [Candidatus Pacearchaeota archaeon]
MVEIKKDSLEKALGKKEEKQPEIPRDVEVGFHQGALNTLINERNELIRMIQQVESVMQAHIKRLEEMGIKIKTSEDKK